MITFKNIDRDNYNDVIDLKIHESQKDFMEDNMYSLAQCYVKDFYIPKAIYNDKDLIGFLLYYIEEEESPYIYLHRYMIDEKYQGNGLGCQALKEALKMFKVIYPSITCIELMYYPENDTAASLYKKLGFKKKSDIKEGDPCYFNRDKYGSISDWKVVCRKYLG